MSTAASACPHCGAKQERKVGPVGVVIALILGWTVFKVASGPGDISPPAVAAAPVAQVSAPERAKIITEATKTLHANRDKMESVTFYMAPKREYLTPKIEAYLSVPDGRPALLRVSAVYYGDDWVFFERIKVMADDVVVYEKTLDRSNIARDNSGGSVWETADYLAQADDEQALRKIAGAKSATIRFAGRDRQHDHTLTEKQRADIRKVLAARDAMKGVEDMKIKSIAIIIASVAALVGAIAYWVNYEKWVKIPDAEQIMADQLRDPSSAQFRRSRIVSSGWLCGEVNSKNGNGGYAGFTRFISGGKEGTFRLEGEGLLGEQPTQEFIDILGKQNEILGALVKMRAQNPDISIPSEGSIREQAVQRIFEDRWKDICA